MRGFVPGASDVGDTLNRGNALAVEMHDRRNSRVVLQRRFLETIIGDSQSFPVSAQRFNDLGNETRKLAFGPRGVAALDDVIAIEGKVVTDEHLAPEADPDRELLVVRVPQANHVGIVAVG